MESLALDAAKSITNVVAGSVFQEINLAWGFKDQLNKLKERLLDTQALMNDLASAEHAEKSQLVSRWIQKLKAVAYSAEDLMDDYAYEMLRRKHQGWDIIEGCRNSLKPSSNRIVFRPWMAHRIKQILSDLDQLYTDPNIVGLQLARKAVSASISAGFDKKAFDRSRRDPTTSGTGTIVRERDVEKLLEMLLNPKGNGLDLPVIAIIGLGGLGKTTLALQLYKHEKVNGQFAKKAYICVSEDFDVDKILKDMLELLSDSTKDGLKTTDAIIKELQKVLKEEKFLLVLDDIWNDKKELWESLKTKLLKIGGLTGSVILITTRSHGVAEACSSEEYELPELSKEDGWNLLQEQVFDEKTFPYDPSFDEVGKRIVEKCKGVPLAIKSIGSLLHSKQDESDWLSIENSELWNIKADDKNYLMPSLLLSYNHINPVNVRQCFAYCAIFPKDSVMEKGKLIALWLSQGLIHDEFETRNSSTTLQASGEECFEILVNNSFLQKENNDDHQAGYKMHDLVHDLATYVLKKELLVWNPKVKIDDVDSQVRHLVFNLKDFEITLAKEQMRKLRTINFWHGMPKWNSLTRARYVRTLVMAGVGLTEVPSVIGQLVHLTYLDLSQNYEIKALPESICKLYQLQTLRVLHCYKLEELPKKLHRLRNLRHIETSYQMYASTGIRKLTCLQTLPHLGLRDGKGFTIDELGPLDQVKGNVCISGLENVKNKEEAREAGIGKKDKISNLELCWGESSEGHNDEVVLDNLEPSTYIQSLEIKRFNGVKFPTWIMTMNVEQRGHGTQLRHLTEVKLTSCRRCQQLPSLGQLSNLRILCLIEFDKVESIGEEFYENETNIGEIKVLFPELRELYFKNFKRLTTWMPPSPTPPTPRSCFPKLETMEIESCPELERLPSLPLKSLKHVRLWDVGVNSLEVTGMNEIVSQREELSNCINLQTLNMFNCEKVKWIHIEDATQLSNLTEVRLTNCKVCKKLPSLGQLPKLTILRLEGFDEVEMIGEEFYESNSYIGEIKVLFPELRELYFKNFKGVTTWMPPSPTPPTPSCFPKIETLEIERCPELESLPSLTLKSLKHVRLSEVGVNSIKVMGMNEIVSQREELSNCINLQTLEMIDCEKVQWIHVEDATQLSNLTEVRLTNCKVCKKLPSLGQLPKLTILTLEGFDEVECIGNEFYADSNNIITNMKELFPALRELHIREFRSLSSWVPPNLGLATTSVFPKLETLNIDDCRLLETVPTSQFESLKNLELSNIGGSQALDMIKGNPGLNSLTVQGMKEVERLPKELSHCINLEELRISDCEKVKWIPSGIISLKVLIIHKCPSLESIEEGVLQGLSSLRWLSIEECSGLSRLPENLEDCTCLEDLSIEDCPLIEGDPIPDISKLQGLMELTLKNAGRMMAYLPRWIPHLHGLEELDITGWGEEWDMSLTSSLPSLTDMCLTNFPNLKPIVPERQHLLPPSLDHLKIEGFEEMEALPDWIGNLQIGEMQLWECKKLKYLPSKPAMLRLSRLRVLNIRGCPLLEKRCDKRNGPEVPKISHLPIVFINRRPVRFEEGQKNRCWVF